MSSADSHTYHSPHLFNSFLAFTLILLAVQWTTAPSTSTGSSTESQSASGGGFSPAVVVVVVVIAGAALTAAVMVAVRMRQARVRDAVARYVKIDSADAHPDTVGIVDNANFDHPQLTELDDEDTCA